MSVWGLEEKRLRAYIGAIKRQLIEASESKCYLCRKPYPKKLFHAHHIKPHALGGSDKASNIAILCPNCHEKFRAKIVTEEEIKEVRAYARKTAKIINGKVLKTIGRRAKTVPSINCYDCKFYRRGRAIGGTGKYRCAITNNEIKKPKSEKCSKFEPKTSAKSRYVKTKRGYRHI